MIVGASTSIFLVLCRAAAACPPSLLTPFSCLTPAASISVLTPPPQALRTNLRSHQSTSVFTFRSPGSIMQSPLLHPLLLSPPHSRTSSLHFKLTYHYAMNPAARNVLFDFDLLSVIACFLSDHGSTNYAALRSLSLTCASFYACVNPLLWSSPFIHPFLSFLAHYRPTRLPPPVPSTRGIFPDLSPFSITVLPSSWEISVRTSSFLLLVCSFSLLGSFF